MDPPISRISPRETIVKRFCGRAVADALFRVIFKSGAFVLYALLVGVPVFPIMICAIYEITPSFVEYVVVGVGVFPICATVAFFNASVAHAVLTSFSGFATSVLTVIFVVALSDVYSYDERVPFVAMLGVVGMLTLIGDAMPRGSSRNAKLSLIILFPMSFIVFFALLIKLYVFGFSRFGTHRERRLSVGALTIDVGNVGVTALEALTVLSARTALLGIQYGGTRFAVLRAEIRVVERRGETTSSRDVTVIAPDEP